MVEVVKANELEWTDVESSNVKSIAYAKDAHKLFVTFNSGSTYSYDGVDEGVYTEFKYADSVGQYLNQKIKPFYAYELVTL